MSDVERQIRALAAGAAAWAGRPAADRAALALRTARMTASAAHAWIDAAADIKRSQDAAVRAEETATGPLATLRLLLITARALADVGLTGLPHVVQPPRLTHGGEPSAARIEVEVLPGLAPRGSLRDAAIFGGHRATVRCVDPGGLDAFKRSWRWCSERATSRGSRRPTASARSSSTAGRRFSSCILSTPLSEECCTRPCARWSMRASWRSWRVASRWQRRRSRRLDSTTCT